MKIVKDGDHGRAICSSCKGMQSITYRLRTVPFDDGTGEVKDLLTGVCDSCGEVATIPHQSVPAIKRVREKKRQSLETRVPPHMVDILGVACETVGAGAEFYPQILKYYLYAMVEKKMSPKRLPGYLLTDLANGRAGKRVSLKGAHVNDYAIKLRETLKLQSTTALVKSLILKINDDIVQHKRKKPLEDLRSIAAAIS